MQIFTWCSRKRVNADTGTVGRGLMQIFTWCSRKRECRYLHGAVGRRLMQIFIWCSRKRVNADIYMMQ